MASPNPLKTDPTDTAEEAAQKAALFAFLDAHGIAHPTHYHVRVYTCETADRETAHIPGAKTKSLFLRDNSKPRPRFWLVVAEASTRVVLKDLGKRLGARQGLRFASAEELRDVLGVEAGSVTPFALLNDAAATAPPSSRVAVVLDPAIERVGSACFHPLHNNATTTITHADLLRFLAATGHGDPLQL